MSSIVGNSQRLLPRRAAEALLRAAGAERKGLEVDAKSRGDYSRRIGAS